MSRALRFRPSGHDSLVVVTPLESALAPALDVALLCARDAESAAGDRLADGRARADVRLGFDGHRRQQIRIAADEGAVADRGSPLLLPVVVDDDGAAAEGDSASYVGVSDVAQVVGLGARADHRVLDL